MQKNLAVGVVVALAVVAVLAFVGMQYLGTAAPSVTPPAGGAVHLWTVNMIPSGFDPSTITISKGDTVSFVNTDTAPHRPASAVHPTHAEYPDRPGPVDCPGRVGPGSKFDACREIMPGENFTFTFDYVGTWKYHDHLNPAHTATIVVQEKGGQY